MFKVAQEKAGFTLVELMVVISIIAILATVGLTVYTSAQIAARDSKRVQDVQQIQRALEQFYAINKYYPGVGRPTTPADMAVLNSYFQAGKPPQDPGNFIATYNYGYYACPQDGNNASQYIVCAQLENCAGRCHKNAAFHPGSDGCGTIGTAGSGDTFYCVKSLSN